MVTHRVRITKPAEINTELLRWLKAAYEDAAARLERSAARPH